VLLRQRPEDSARADTADEDEEAAKATARQQGQTDPFGRSSGAVWARYQPNRQQRGKKSSPHETSPVGPYG